GAARRVFAGQGCRKCQYLGADILDAFVHGLRRAVPRAVPAGPGAGRAARNAAGAGAIAGAENAAPAAFSV
nr:hypothetical protein [Tanacetum cinerariifolium]